MQHEERSFWFGEVSKIEISYFNSIREAALEEIKAVINENPLHNKIKFNNEADKIKHIENMENKYKEKHHPLVYQAIQHCGSPRFFCEALGISKQAVDKWKGGLPELRRFQIEKMLKETKPADQFKVRRAKDDKYQPIS